MMEVDNMKRSIRYKGFLIGLIIAMLATGIIPAGLAEAVYKEKPLAVRVEASADDTATWIIQWNSAPPKQFWAESDVKDYYPDSQVTSARPKQGVSLAEWRDRWQNNSLVDSVQPNQKVKTALTPNDPLFSNQRYLKQIRAEAAWDVVTSAEMVIAIVDTGVDLTHPDLEDRLVPGFNLVKPGTDPMDDNGHGTNVAGVIASAADNDKGTAGLLWQSRIMPVKALEADGNGDEDKLGEGIRYAVQHGAKIVVLSLGLNKYSSYMERVVQEAENAGVLLVAASGNEGNVVKYPAAYDTVLAVGGVGSDNTVESKSNKGPELDLVAPWVVFTTTLGGGYDFRDGTSMAAPQAAGAAALAWTVRPELKPAEVRNLLRQTAQSIGGTGWTPDSGYGMLRVDRAVMEAPKWDIYEPNNRQSAAKAISSNKSIHAYMEPGEEDWFYWDAPYDGVARYRISGAGASLDLAHVTEAGIEEQVLTNPTGDEVAVSKGRHYVKITGSAATSTPYTLSVDYGIYRDPFEDNDRQYKAYTLLPRSQLVVGTFDHAADQDWYTIHVEQSGTLQLKVAPDTARMDLVMTIVRKGGKELVIDHNGDGESEFFQMDVTPGQYYIKISNIPSYTYPVVGEYVLDIHLSNAYEDPYEPNDKPYQATVLSFGEPYTAVIDPETDIDWYRFRLNGESDVRIEFNMLSNSDMLSMQLMDASLKPVSHPFDAEDRNSWLSKMTLPGGVYYLRVSSTGAGQQLYGLRVRADQLVEGYADIYSHWAKDAMVKLIDKGFVNGYGSKQLYPDRPITRAEAVVLLDRILKPGQASPPGFHDVEPDHWAYGAVSRLYNAKIVNGMTSTTFAPDRNITRMEMMTLLAKAVGKTGLDIREAPFSDVSAGYWGNSLLWRLKQDGWAEGYADGTFRPERSATRAELMALTVRMLGL